MAASNHNLILFLKSVHTVYLEQMKYKINMFNAAARGVIVLDNKRVEKMAGGVEVSSFFGRVDEEMIERRDPNGMRPLEIVNLNNKLANRIRLAWTTKLLNLSRNQWDWIGRSPHLAAATFGTLLADSILEVYLIHTFGILRATVGSNPATFLDATKYKKKENRTINNTLLEVTANLFGDQQALIRAWIMPTNSRTKLLLTNLENKANLFTFGTVNIWHDASGRTFFTTDDPNLIEYGVDGAGNADTLMHWIYGLTPGSVVWTELDDWDDLTAETAGYENITKTYQANWSTRLGVKGYKFDADLLMSAHNEDGVDDPYISASSAAIMSNANWSQVEQSHKTTAGVALRVAAGTLIDDE